MLLAKHIYTTNKDRVPTYIPLQRLSSSKGDVTLFDMSQGREECHCLDTKLGREAPRIGSQEDFQVESLDTPDQINFESSSSLSRASSTGLADWVLWSIGTWPSDTHLKYDASGLRICICCGRFVQRLVHPRAQFPRSEVRALFARSPALFEGSIDSVTSLAESLSGSVALKLGSEDHAKGLDMFRCRHEKKDIWWTLETWCRDRCGIRNDSNKRQSVADTALCFTTYIVRV